MPRRIISLVGLRALPVVSPLYSYITNYKSDASDVLLLHTDVSKSKEVALRCQTVLRTMKLESKLKRFPETVIELKELLAAESADEIIFNFNPGMNWQIAMLCLALPELTNLLASDANNLYCWCLADDIKDCREIALQNLGLSLYSELNSYVKIEMSNKKNNRLSKGVGYAVNNILDGRRCLMTFNDDEVGRYSNISALINESLVWLRERRGYLHLLFDLDAAHNSKIEPYNMLRLITSIFDPLNYFVTVLTEKPILRERAAVEGVASLSIAEIGDWIQSDKDVKPKNIISSKARTHNMTVKVTPGEEKLFTCLGDNVEPTLSAIISFMKKPGDVAKRQVVIFYDKHSARICFIARKMEQKMLLGGCKLSLVETDHKGSGIMDHIRENARGTCFFNITPGTKMQTVAMSSAARLVGRSSSVFSLHGGSNKAILTTENYPVHPPSVEDVIDCMIPPKTSEVAQKADNELWESILSGLCDTQLIPGHDLRSICAGNKGAFKMIPERQIIVRRSNKKEYKLAGAYNMTGGAWWEQTVATALRKKLNVNTRVNLKWGWFWGPQEKRKEGTFYSELDIVFSYEGRICVVSCKTKKSGGLAHDALVVRSETDKRFGRFALAFLALPWEEMAERVLFGVKVLSPQILSNSSKLRRSVLEFMKQKRTSLLQSEI